MKHQAVIFDLFGTLIPTFCYEEHDRMLARMADLVDAPLAAFTEGWVQTGPQRSVGEFQTAEACIRHICRALDLAPDEEAVAQAAGLRLDLIRQAMTARSDAVETLTRLRGRGLKVGLVSNCPAEVPRLWDGTPFAGLLEAPVFSCSVGLRKPDPRIYRLACERLGVEAGACLFVGDGGSRELSGALAVGMAPVQILDPQDDPQDALRESREDWTGPAIQALSQILDFVR